ncbi:hypothetical protein SAMN04490248_1157 [Salinihabitans flavidus]|uniref:Lipoprotein n=1 Tax=Salinihabitans flavidus TaxID=569882 RepID=A0A1H8TCH5_9RHOB|nr:hypothetical protein [Salinihabitans flavidus]SEO88525.1 hypothetical protein SAMN04490248_1157 [Salinihabitans flavidus]
MRKSLLVLLTSSVVLSGCDGVRDSVLNPFNWFGGARSAPVESAENTNPLIPQRNRLSLRREVVYAGTPVQRISDLEIERTPGGAIVNVTGIAARQGVHSLKLEALNDGEPVDGVLSFRFLGVHPTGNARVGREFSRELHAARNLTRQQLQGVRVIRVSGAANALESRRR